MFSRRSLSVALLRRQHTNLLLTTRTGIFHGVMWCSILISVTLLLLSGVKPITCLQASTSAASGATTAADAILLLQPRTKEHDVGNVLILDHINLNHERGRHDWLKAFYFDFLGCSVDPRKAENLERGRKTLWANFGAQQFHLPEGKPNAQVLEGIVTLAYSKEAISNMMTTGRRLDEAKRALEGSKFKVLQGDNDEQQNPVFVTDPWGSQFRVVVGDDAELDSRGTQAGVVADGHPSSNGGLGMRDLTLYCNANANMAGIARFYNQWLGCPILSCDDDETFCSVSVGPRQTLSFVKQPTNHIQHEDLRDDKVEPPKGHPSFLSNYGPHVSIYVSDLGKTYDSCKDLAYVNPRFKRRAYTKQQALEQCMFRVLDIVDPEDPEAGPILKLEHEIRSVVNIDGSKYKSCPFDEIPESVVRL